MKFSIKYLVVLLFFFSKDIEAQKFGFELEMGARGDKNNVVFSRGGVREVNDGYLHFQSRFLYNYSENLFFSTGVGLNHYGLNTTSVNALPILFPSFAEHRILVGVPLHIDYKLLTFRKLNVEVGTGVQFLFTGLINQTTIFSRQDFEFNDPENSSSRRTVITNRAVHLIPNIHTRLVYNFSPKFAAYFSHQYNQGIGTIFTRSVEFNYLGELGGTKILTNGTGLQSAFGIRFNTMRKVK